MQSFTPECMSAWTPIKNAGYVDLIPESYQSSEIRK